MSTPDPVQGNIKRSRAIELLLQRLGYTDTEMTARLAADLGDLYVGCQRYQQQFDALLAAPVEHPDRHHDLLTEMWVELQHLEHHIQSSGSAIEAVASELD